MRTLLLALLLSVFPLGLMGQSVVTNRTYASGESATQKGPLALTAGTAVVASSGSNVTYLALTRVTLIDGFRANSGSTFRAQIVVDAIAPLAATSLTATPSSTAVQLSWGVAADGFWLDRVEVWRKQGSGAFEKVVDLPPASYSYLDSGLTPVTTYTYFIRAVDAAMLSSDTSPVIATTQSDPMVDSDSDGIPDGVEQALGTSTTTAGTTDSATVKLNSHKP